VENSFEVEKVTLVFQLTNYTKMILKTTIILILSLIPLSSAITCWQCASTDGKMCPKEAKSFTSGTHDACITWRLGNGTILLQNLVNAQEECTDEKVSFWSQFVDLYYKTYGGSVSCCYADGCNDGQSAFNLYPNPLPISSSQLSPNPIVTRSPLNQAPPSLSIPVSGSSFIPNDNLNLNNLNNLNSFPAQSIQREGNCERYFDKINSDEWVPDTLVPLAFDRASESKVGVFYAKLGERTGNNDHVVVRILNKAKQNLTMYSVKLFRVGTVSIHINKLESPRNGGNFIQQDGRKVSVNAVIDLDKDRYQGFWISIKNNVEISIGRIGDKLIDSVANFTDVLREGPSEPYYFGLTTPVATIASFGVNCDMPGLHFEDTCVSNDDCEEFPQTVCQSMPVNIGLDPGTRSIPYEKWKEGDEILKSCWCKEGHMRIPESKGCYDPIRKVVTLKDACFSDYHCNDLPNTICAHDLFMDRYNRSCQCIPGNKPFEPNPRTGLVEGCAPLTKKDKATVSGCSRRFTLEAKAEWVPETVFPIEHDEFFRADVAVFFVTLGSMSEPGNDEKDTAVIRLLDNMRDRRKMYTIKIFRQGGKIALYESKITRSFFFSNENDREVAKYEDPQLLRRLEQDYVGFWVQYKYEEGYGGQLSVGLNGAPFSPDFALVKWTDTSTSAIGSIKYMGFTNGERASTIDYGANCVLLKTQNSFGLSPYVQVSPQQIQQLQYQLGQNNYYNQNPQAPQINNRPSNSQPNPWDYLNTPDILEAKTIEHQIQPRPEQTVIEPKLKSQYLTKLKRILPSYLEELQDGEMVAKLEEMAESGAV